MAEIKINDEVSESGENKPDPEMNKKTLLAVLQFLKKNNLKDTEDLLRREAKLTDEDVKDESLSQTPSQVSHALAAYKSEGDPSLYDDYYTSLRDFVDTSVDIHRCEISTVLYPVFVQMYLELVYNNHEEEAKKFYEKFSVEQEDYYAGDMKQMAMVTKAEHMQGNLLMENFKQSKFNVKMSRDSYNHLKRFLIEKKLNILLNIIHEHLFVDVFDGAPRSKQIIDATSGSMVGEAHKEANKQKVFFGLLKEPELNVQLDDEEEDEADKPKKKKQKKDPLFNKKAKNDPNAPSLNRIPLPELKDNDKREKARAIRESVKRVPVSNDSPPSILFYTLLNSQQGVTSVNFSEDSSLAATGFADSSIRVFSLTPNKLRRMKPADELNLIDMEADDVLERMMDDRTASDMKVLKGHSGPVYATSFNQDRNFMVSASGDGSVRLWGLQMWTNLVQYKGHCHPVWDVKFSNHGHYFASCGYDRTARLWSTDHYQCIRIFSGHIADVDCIQFHPNTNYIATGSTDRTVRLWDVQSGHSVRIYTGHKGPVHTVEFSPDGRYIVSAGTDKVIHVWDIQHGALVGQLKGHTDTIYSLGFSRDGSALASGGLDNTVKVWDMSRLLEDQDAETIAGLTESSSSYLIGSWATKQSPVLACHFTRRNLLMAGGPFVK